MKLLINEAIDRQQWHKLIASNPFASSFQTPAFYDLYNSVPGYSAQALAVEDNGELCALVVVSIQQEKGIKGYFSRRGIIYGGPLFDPEEPQRLEMLLEGFDAMLSRQVIYLETRNFFDYGSCINIFSRCCWKYVPYCNFQLNLANRQLEDILAGMDYNRRREIRLGLNEGATYDECRNEQELIALYAILSDLYEKRVKLPLPSLDFFQTCFKNGICKIFIVKHNSKVIGGSVCPFLPGQAIYTFYYCGVRDYHKRIFPTHLAVLAAIEYGIRNKIPILDFMGAGQPAVDYGVRKYKKEFGGELIEHGRFLKVTKPMLYSIGKVGLKMMARIKS